MKKSLALSSALLLLLCSNSPVLASKTFDGKFYDASQMLDLTDLSAEEVDSYYSSLDDTSKGEEFRSELYDIISKDNYFIEYGSGSDSGVNKWYKITDRNWELSSSIDPATYKFKNDTASTYYLTLLYFQNNNDVSKAINSYVNGYTVDSSLTALDHDNKKKNNSYIQEDKEHVWAKSHGFSPDGDPAAGAGTDLHHLIAADHNTNNLHNNLYYGNVKDKSTAKEVLCYYADGSTAVSGWIGPDVDGDNVFEPTDVAKGDIARALLYMGVRYSKYLETNTREEPYLLLTDDKNQADDNEHFHGVHQHLSDILQWNELDPVSDYEIHRNNLIYNNVQNNRNPFVDHPEWARRVYDPDNYIITDDFSKLDSKYEMRVYESLELPVTYAQDSTTVVEYDSSYIQLSNDKKTIKALKTTEEGTVIKFIVTNEDGTSTTYETKIYVKDNAALVPGQGFERSYSLSYGQEQELNFSVNNMFDDEKVIIESSDESVIKIENRKIQVQGFGSATVSIYLYTVSNKKVSLGTISVEVPFTGIFKDMRVWIIIGIITVVLIILLIILIVFNKKKKGSRPGKRNGRGKRR